MDQYRENIKYLVRNPETPAVKPPLYRSVFADSVKRTYKAQKDCHRTMGYANVYSDPSQFLRAHTRPFDKKPIKDRMKSCSRKLAEKPPVPKLTRAKISDNKTKRNLIQENITDVKKKVPPLPKHRVQDTRTGHVMVLDEAGLEPTFMSKKGYGKMPAYLVRMAKEKELAKKEEEERKRAIKPPMRYLPENERKELLNGLNTNRLSLIKEYSLLPLVIETIIYRQKKLKLEKELNDVEKYIALLENNSAIYVCQKA